MSKAIPKLRFKEFDSKWEKKKLGEVTQYTKGFAFKSDDYQNTGKRIIRVSDLGVNQIKVTTEKIFIDESKVSEFKKYQLKKGDIIITTVGSKPEMIESAVGRGIFVKRNDEGLLNQNLLKFENIEGVDNGFVMGLINSKRYQTHIKGIARGNANQANITVVDLLDYKISIPTLPEQQKIASFLSSVDEKIQQLTRKKELLEHYKKGVMQRLFKSSELGLQGLEDDRKMSELGLKGLMDDGINPIIPKSQKSQFRQLRFKDENGKAFPKWVEKKLGDIGKIITGSTPATSNSEFYSGDKLFVSPADINGGRVVLDTKTTLTDLGFKEGRLVTKGSVLFVCIGSTIGKVAQAGKQCITNQQINSIEANKDNSNEFLYSLLEFYAAKIKPLAGTQAVPQINKSDFSKLRFAFPSLEEQQKIANYLSAIDTKIESVANQITQTQTFKKGLLQQMFV